MGRGLSMLQSRRKERRWHRNPKGGSLSGRRRRAGAAAGSGWRRRPRKVVRDKWQEADWTAQGGTTTATTIRYVRCEDHRFPGSVLYYQASTEHPATPRVTPARTPLLGLHLAQQSISTHAAPRPYRTHGLISRSPREHGSVSFQLLPTASRTNTH